MSEAPWKSASACAAKLSCSCARRPSSEAPSMMPLKLRRCAGGAREVLRVAEGSVMEVASCGRVGGSGSVTRNTCAGV